MLVYLFIVVLSAVCLHVYIRYGKHGNDIARIPGPPAMPIIGSVGIVFKKGADEIWNILQEQLKKYYPVGKVWFFTTLIVFIKSPEDLKIIMSDKVNISKGAVYSPIHQIANDGLITGTGELWQHRRKIITPAFHANIIKKYMEITAEQGERFIRTIKAAGDESIQNLIPIFSDLTLSIILEAAMGIEFKTMGDEADKFKVAIDNFFSHCVYRATRPYIQNWMLRFYSSGRKTLADIETILGFTAKIVKERREYHKHTKHQSFQNYMDNVDDTDFQSGGVKKRLAMLDLLLLAEKEGLIDGQGIQDEVVTFTAAGYDTTGMAMVYLFMLLAENKDVQELARAEAKRILDGSGGKITMVEIQQMEYIERCIKETLRLYPTAPHILRVITKDLQLTNHKLPVGCDLAIPIYGIHRLEQFWPDPLKFNPDRFLPEEIEKRQPFTYLPFSHGPRNCIGQKFAMAEMKSILARVLYNFYLEPVSRTEDLKFRLHIVLAPTENQYVKFIKINK